jgi:hypothetical protein
MRPIVASLGAAVSCARTPGLWLNATIAAQTIEYDNNFFMFLVCCLLWLVVVFFVVVVPAQYFSGTNLRPLSDAWSS